MHLKMSQALTNDWEYRQIPEPVRQKRDLLAATLDWKRDTGRMGRRSTAHFKQPGMTYDQFFHSLFEMADLWTDSMDPLDYVHFLRALFYRITISREERQRRHRRRIKRQHACHQGWTIETDANGVQVEVQCKMSAEGGMIFAQDVAKLLGLSPDLVLTREDLLEIFLLGGGEAGAVWNEVVAITSLATKRSRRGELRVGELMRV